MDTHSQMVGGATIDSFLARAASGLLEAPPELWGFGGLHGGLTLAAAVSRIQAMGPAGPLRSVGGQFLRSIRDTSTVEATVDGESTRIASYSAKVTTQGRTVTTATALYGAARPPLTHSIAPAAPSVLSWGACEVLEFPRELVPVSAHTEIRPVGASRPFAGGPDPELMAWVRLACDDIPPDVLRLIFLLDALAPSYAAVLDSPQPIPTVEMTMHVTYERASSPWVLLSTRTEDVTEDGWLTERIDAWDAGGHHLAHARQLRVIAHQNSQERA